MKVTNYKLIRAVSVLVILLLGTLWGVEKKKSWMNPNIGFTGDIIVDVSDVEGMFDKATSQGINIRAGELTLGASIDPYAKFYGNLNFGTHGAALHELYAWFPVLPANLSMKIGYKLANFGRWNRFHTHAMPFAAEPRIYMEYFGGHFSGTGIEISWLSPLPFYLETTLSAYDVINGHTHDSDPSLFESESEKLAFELGYTKHGSHWHNQDGGIVLESEIIDPMKPSLNKSNKKINDFAYAGRINTTFEFGSDWSADLGGSAVFQPGYRHSNRLDRSYSKGVFGGDLTVFWHPLTMNKYRNLDLGIEWLMNYEENELFIGGEIYETGSWRQGFFSHLHFRLSQRWHFGVYAELFEALNSDSFLRKRFGLFTTMEISHYQYLRLELSRYQKWEHFNPVHRITLQYDATIGFHSHGRQR